MRKILFLVLAATLSSCSKFGDHLIIDQEDKYLKGDGVYILNEGNFRSGNGSLSFFSYDSLKVYNNVFTDINKRPLGDIPYSMNVHKGKAYIIVNNSGKIEIANSSTMMSSGILDKLSSPRYISFANDEKAYVTSLYSDSLVILNTVSGTVQGFINLKHTSESIVVINKAAYIASWVGGNIILIVDTEIDQVVDSLEVGHEPESMVVDRYGKLWILCNGGWRRDHYAELVGINTTTNEIETRLVFPSIDDSPTCLAIDGTGQTLYYIMNGIRKMNINSGALPEEVFIPESGHLFYRMGINPVNDEIFITDAADYVSRGKILRYSKTGVLISKMDADIVPGNMYFKVDSDLETE